MDRRHGLLKNEINLPITYCPVNLKPEAYGSASNFSNRSVIQTKARLTKDVRYQEFCEVTLDCNKVFLT